MGTHLPISPSREVRPTASRRRCYGTSRSIMSSPLTSDALTSLPLVRLLIASSKPPPFPTEKAIAYRFCPRALLRMKASRTPPFLNCDILRCRGHVVVARECRAVGQAIIYRREARIRHGLLLPQRGGILASRHAVIDSAQHPESDPGTRARAFARTDGAAGATSLTNLPSITVVIFA